jgi:hypothetical protein
LRLEKGETWTDPRRASHARYGNGRLHDQSGRVGRQMVSGFDQNGKDAVLTPQRSEGARRASARDGASQSLPLRQTEKGSSKDGPFCVWRRGRRGRTLEASIANLVARKSMRGVPAPRIQRPCRGRPCAPRPSLSVHWRRAHSPFDNVSRARFGLHARVAYFLRFNASDACAASGVRGPFDAEQERFYPAWRDAYLSTILARLPACGRSGWCEASGILH